MAQRGAVDGWEQAGDALGSVDPLGLTRLPGGETLAADTPRAARDAVTAMLRPHVLDVLDGPDAFHADVAVAGIGPITLLDISYRRAVRIRRAATDAYAAVLIPVHGRILVRHRGADFVAEPYRTMAVIGTAERLDAEWGEAARALILRVETTALSDALQALDRRPGPALSIGSGPLSGAQGFALYGAVQLLIQHLGQASPRGAGASMRRRLVQQTLFTALLALPHSRQLDLAGAAPVRSETVRLAMDLIDSEQAAELSVGEIASRLGVSIRALELGFRRELEVTPHAYLSDARLRRAHEELLSGDPDATTVGIIATKWGFEHHGRFAQRYRSQFGEAPTVTLRS